MFRRSLLVCALVLGLPVSGLTSPTRGTTLDEIEHDFSTDRQADRQKNGEPLLVVGQRLLAEGRVREAVATLKQALERHSGEPRTRGRVLIALARAQAALKEYTLARAALDLVLRDGPASLACEAQYEKGLIESEHLLTPDRFKEVLRRLSLENPVTLDFDLLQYLVGVERGFRLDRVDRALRELETAWTRYPQGSTAADALLAQALIEGLVLSKHTVAWDRVEKLCRDYPRSKTVPVGRVLQGAIAMAQGDHARALGPLARVEADQPFGLEALYLRGIAEAYYLEKPEDGLQRFEQLEDAAQKGHWEQVARYHRALLTFTAKKDPARAKGLLSSLVVPPPDATDTAARDAARLAQYRSQLGTYVDDVAGARSDEEREFSYAAFWYANHHFSQALSCLEKFLTRFPGSSFAGRARVMQGKILQEDVVRPSKAAAALSAAQESGPPGQQPEIAWRKARSQRGEEESANAMEAIYKDKASPFHLLAGVEKAKEGELKEREKRELLAEVVRSEPSGDVRAKLLSQLAKAYLDGGNPRRALEVYHSALSFDAKLAPEISRARRTIEVQDIEGRLARGEGEASKGGDAMLQLRLGRLLVALGRDEEAKKAFKAAAKAGDKAKKPRKPAAEKTKEKKGEEPEAHARPAGPPVDGSPADKARLELVKLQVKAAKFPPQALRYVKEYLDTVDDGSLQRLQALEVKVSILENGYDPDSELVDLYRYLYDCNFERERSAVRLARAYEKEKKLEKALAVLAPVEFGKEYGPEALALQAKLCETLKRPGDAAGFYRRLIAEFPASAEAKEAGNSLAQHLTRSVQKALARSAPGAELGEAVLALASKLRPEWVGAVNPVLSRIASPPAIDALELEPLEKLIDLVSGSKDADRAVLARFQAKAAELSREPRVSFWRNEQALSLEAAGDAERAVALLTEIAPRFPKALLSIAIIQERRFKDLQAARARLDEFLARTDIAPADRVKALLRKAQLATPEEDPAAMLESAVASFTDGGQRALLLERIAQLTAEKARGEGKTAAATGEAGATPEKGAKARVRQSGALLSKAAGHWLQAAAVTPDDDERVRLTLEGARALMDAGQFAEASKVLREARGRPDGDTTDVDPRITDYFMRSEALGQLSRLENSINWDDPESPTNLQVMLMRTRLLISPLREYDRAQAQISQIEGLFPQAPKDELDRLKREMNNRWALKSLEEKPDKLPRDLMQLAVTLEEELSDHASAARYLKELLANHADDPLALIARLRLIRLYALYLNRREDAARLSRPLLGMNDSSDLKPEVTAAVNLIVASDRFRSEGVKSRQALSTGDTAAAVRHLGAMGKIAVFDFRDLSQASEVLAQLTRLAEAPGSSNGARGAAFTLAVAAACELSPLKAAVYALSDRAGFLKTALTYADPGEQKSRVLYEMGLDALREQDKDRAAELFDQASREAPSSPFGRQALLELARVQEARKDMSAARDAYARLGEEGSERYVKLAAKQLPRLEKLARSSEREQELGRTSKATPSEYYNLGKNQMDEDEDFENALTNFRTYMRLGRDQKKLVDAHIRSAELLARLNRPKEGLEALEKALSRYPADARAGEMMFKLGQMKEVQLADLKSATEEYRQVKKRWPRTRWAAEADKALARVNQTERDRAKAQKAGSKRSTAGGDIQAIRKKYLDERGSVDEALAAIKAQIEATTAPQDLAELWLALGTIYDQELKNYAEAVPAYVKFLELSGDLLKKGDVHMRVAELKADPLREPEEALDMYKEFGTKFFNHPKRIDALLAMAQLQEKKLNDVQAAVNIYRNIADSYPRSGYDEKALLRIAELSRTHFADYPGAVEALRRLVRDFPFSTNAPYAQLQIANILEVEMGDKNNAATEYQRLIDAYPQSPYADGARQALVRIKGR